MREIRVGTAQFEVRDADKSYNLGVIERLARDAAVRGAELVNFNECCISGYTFLETLTRQQVAEIAECVPGGPSTERLGAIARSAGIALSAGLVEKEGGSRLMQPSTWFRSLTSCPAASRSS